MTIQHKLWHIVAPPHPTTELSYEDWQIDDCVVIDWILNNLHESCDPSIVFLPTDMRMWEPLKRIYSNDNNISRVFEFYEQLFAFYSRDQFIIEYSSLRAILDELDLR